jgi:hypothetical protein
MENQLKIPPFPNRTKIYSETQPELSRLKELPKTWESLNRLRGEIISSATSIEIQLGETICELLFNKQTSQIMLDSVINKEFFTFVKKLDLFKNAIKKLIPKLEPETKELRKNLRKIMEIRNNFAHGQITHDPQKNYLEFRREGKNKKIEIRQDYINTIKKLFEETSISLQKTRYKINQNLKTKTTF